MSLRLVEPADAELVARWFGEPDHLGTYYNVWPESRTDRERSFSKDLDVHDKALMLIERKDTAEPIGTIGYWKPFTLGLFSAFEIYYHLHPSARRQRAGPRPPACS